MEVALGDQRFQNKDLPILPEAEQNVQRSKQILLLLADFEDRKKQEEAPSLRKQIDEQIRRFDEQGKDQRDDETVRSEPIGLSRSMLEVSVSLAREMTRPAEPD